MAHILCFSSGVREIDDLHFTLPKKGKKIVPTELWQLRQGSHNVVLAKVSDGTVYLLRESNVYGDQTEGCLTVCKNVLKEYITPLFKAGLISEKALTEATERVAKRDLQEKNREAAASVLRNAPGVVVLTDEQIRILGEYAKYGYSPVPKAKP
jgi:hypothetical protein